MEPGSGLELQLTTTGLFVRTIEWEQPRTLRPWQHWHQHGSEHPGRGARLLREEGTDKAGAPGSSCLFFSIIVFAALALAPASVLYLESIQFVTTSRQQVHQQRLPPMPLSRMRAVAAFCRFGASSEGCH